MNKSKISGCLYGLAIADSIGRDLEYLSKQEIIKKHGEQGLVDFPEKALYTDETQMTFSLINALLESKAESIENFMAAFSKEMILWHDLQENKDINRFPSKTCLDACKQLKEGVSWDYSGSETSTGNASVIRSCILGTIFNDPIKVVEYSKESARVTHDTCECLCSTVSAALMCYLAYKNEPIGLWGNEISKHIKDISPETMILTDRAILLAALKIPSEQALVVNELGLGFDAISCVASAFYCCLMNPDSFKDAVLMAINIEGDSDSVGALVGAIMGTKLGIENIPEDWIKKVEDSVKINNLSEKLFSLAKFLES